MDGTEVGKSFDGSRESSWKGTKMSPDEVKRESSTIRIKHLGIGPRSRNSRRRRKRRTDIA